MSAAQTPARKRCHLAWHVTSRCNRTCRHCLRHTSGQAQTDLPHDQCLQILDSFIQFAKETDRDAEVEFSGGNPLLRDDFLDLLQRTHAFKREGIVKHIRILGNPETLDETTVNALKAAEVDEFFLSMDGLEETNDLIRGKGSFAATLKGLRALVRSGVPPRVKFTLFRPNARQVMDVIKLLHDEKIRHLGIGPLMPVGGGYDLRDQALSPLEYRQVLLEILHFLDAGGETYADFRRAFLGAFVGQGGMHALLFHELGRYDEYRALTGRDRRPPRMSGNVLFVVWSDGEVVVRREMARVGWVPRDSFLDIYKNAPLLHLLEDSPRVRELAKAEQANYIKCSSCPVKDDCLPGLVGTFNSQLFFAPNRHCWR